MPAGDAIPGWGYPSDEGSSAPRNSIPDRLAETWRVYLTYLRPGLELALPIQGVLGLVYAPASVVLAFTVEEQWGRQGTLASGDPSALRQMLAIYFPSDWLSVLGRSLALAGGLLTVILLTVAFALFLESAREGSRVPRPSLPTILRRASAFVVPVAVAALAGAALNLLESAWITSGSSSLLSGNSSVEDLTGPIFAIDGLIIVLASVVTYALARWTLAIPAAAIEQLGLRKALARSSELSRGHRLHILLSLLVVSFATGLATVGTVFVATLVTGALWGSSSGLGFALSLVAFLAALVLTAPLIPILIVVLHRDLRDAIEMPGADHLPTV
jgi:Membrane domain of glycerophosphoryl diester phosphodiesterase